MKVPIWQYRVNYKRTLRFIRDNKPRVVAFEILRREYYAIREKEKAENLAEKNNDLEYLLELANRALVEITTNRYTNDEIVEICQSTLGLTYGKPITTTDKNTVRGRKGDTGKQKRIAMAADARGKSGLANRASRQITARD